MARFDLTAGAQADIAAVVDYTTRQWGAAQADNYLDALEARLYGLASQPMLGHERPELAEGIRSFPVESHIVYYLRTDFGIVVLRILHKRQDPRRHVG